MVELIQTVINPIDYMNRCHEKIMALIDQEAATLGPNPHRVGALWQASRILTDTMGEMTDEAIKEITEKQKA